MLFSLSGISSSALRHGKLIFLGGPALISAHEIVFLDPFSTLPHIGLFMPLSDIIIYHILIWVLLVCLVPLTICKFFQVREDILLVFVFTAPKEVTGLQYVPNSYLLF